MRQDSDGKAEIHSTTVYKVFARWSDDGSLEHAFIASVAHLSDQHHLDLRVLHGDGTNTVANKGGDGIGYSGHKHQKGDKGIAIIDNHGYVLAPLPEERPHQGKGNIVLFPSPSQDQECEGPIQCRERLGGLLKYYHRKAA